jgi:hypothetical protein
MMSCLGIHHRQAIAATAEWKGAWARFKAREDYERMKAARIKGDFVADCEWEYQMVVELDRVCRERGTTAGALIDASDPRKAA